MKLIQFKMVAGSKMLTVLNYAWSHASSARVRFHIPSKGQSFVRENMYTKWLLCRRDTCPSLAALEEGFGSKRNLRKKT